MKATRISPKCKNRVTPEVLSEYTVLEEQVKPSTGAIYYRIAELDPEVAYHSELFAILPERSADEMQEENHESITYQR